MPLANAAVRDHAFLKDMFADTYFPKHLVEKGKQILLALCARIEGERPADAAAVIVLTHAATEEFNALAEEFGEEGSEIETAAREAIAEDFGFILESYGFDVDLEDAIATRDW
jgi:hypothetical protein